MNGYNWQETDITISNNVIEMILDTFDRYNFTVKEDDPLDKEVAIDPEMLGKVFENLLPENLKKGNGAFYTPRPIVHYMCQESLINYLDTHLDIDKNDITLLVKEGEAVVEHDKIANSKEVINKLKYQQRMPSSIIENANEIDKLLTYVKICDPAIGSGAFPMGLLHEIVVARNILTTYIGEEDWRTKYKLKNDCIQNSIYGVDIDEGAIEISKLRLWLSLIVDEDDIENIKPLPNLDYKIICGNSLISRYELDSPIDVVFTEFNKKVKSKDYTNSAIKNLVGNQEVDLKFYKKLTNDFLSESSHSKKIIFRELIGEIKKAFKTELDDKDRAKLSEARGALENLSRIDIFGDQEGSKNEISKAQKTLERLEKQKQETLDGALYKNALEWRIEFPNLLNESGDFHGFDIVIANPPYLGHKGGQKKIFDIIKKTSLGIRFNNERMDLFYYFFHLAIDIGNNVTEISFITTNYFTTADSAIKLRKDFYNRTNIRKLVNFNETTIFDTAKGQHNMLTFLTKNNKITNSQTVFLEKGGKLSEEMMRLIDDYNTKGQINNTINKTELFEGNKRYIRISNVDSDKRYAQDRIFNKLKLDSTSLISICDISQGVVSGMDKITDRHIKKISSLEDKKGYGVFVLSLEEGEYIGESEIIRPWFKNSDISKWNVNELNKRWLIHLHTDLDLNNYPSILSHINEYKEIILTRNYDSGELTKARNLKKWWALSSSRKDFDFLKPKIVSPQRSYVNTFGYTKKEWLASGDVYFITQKDKEFDLKFILSLLNSKLYFFWLFHKGKRKGNMLELYLTPLSEIPIKVAVENMQQKFALLADKIIDGKKNEEDTTVLEHKVDVMVYKLYELTYEEVLIVDEVFAMSEGVYNNFEL